MPEPSQALSLNLRRIRLTRAISLSELARESGVSKATLSLLERGVGNPSVDTVWALARTLNVSFGDLFASDDRDVIQVTRLDDAPVVGREGGFTGRELLHRQRRGDLEIYVLDLEPDVVRKAAAHSPGVVEHIIVVTGTVEVGPEDDPRTLSGGDCLSFLADRPHRYIAIDGPARLLSLTDYP